MLEIERNYVQSRLPTLIEITSCDVSMLARLATTVSFSSIEVNDVNSRPTTQEKAARMYELAMTKHEGYDKLAVVLQECEQTEALGIFMEGYIAMNKLIPADLDSNFWKKIIKFKWRTREWKLEELFGENISEEKYQKIYDAFKKQIVISNHFNGEPMPLIMEQLIPPSQPKYYIPRTLLRCTELDPKVFMAPGADIYLFKGMDIAELAKLTENEMNIDQSWNVLKLRKLTARFVILEHDEHYDGICGIAANETVHVIQQERGHYFWVKSNNRGLDSIRNVLKTGGKSMSEQEMVCELLTVPPPCSITIVDTPGMGKTLLLANLAKEISEIDQNSLVFFIVLQEFLQNRNISGSSAIDAIAEYASCDSITKLVLTEMLIRKSRPIYVFLDGYDEMIENNRFHQVDTFLKDLEKVCNMKVIVTSRPHLKARLEDIFCQLSHTIVPFSEINQSDFLQKYWINHDVYEAEETPILEEFAKECLAALEKRLTNKEKAITGIPLQCMLLAEVYAEDAKSASVLKTIHPRRDSMVAPTSLFDMYKKLMELKFKRIPQPNFLEFYMNAHVHFAISLLFSEWIEVFVPILNGLGEIDEKVIYSIGLVEKSPQDTKPRFIHRTFAEYLLAQFIVENLDTHTDCRNILFQNIIGWKGTNKQDHDGMFYYDLNYPVVMYFIEMHLKDFFEQRTPNNSLFPIKKFIHLEDVYIAIRACCSHDLESTLDLAMEIAHGYGEIVRLTHLERDYFMELPHLVVRRTSNNSMLKKVLKYTKEVLRVSLKFHTSEMWNKYLYLPEYTPLHEAVFEGKYNMVIDLVKEYGGHDEVRKMKNLMHACVHFSGGNSEPVIKEKLLIVDMLVKINRDWLSETDSQNCTPLLVLNVHFTLTKHLLQHEADINAYSCQRGTVLHTVINYDEQRRAYKDLVTLVLSNAFNFNRINHTDEFKRTPLMHALVNFGTVEDEVLDMFHKAKADFNARDNHGNSVLFYTIQYSGNINFIKKLLEYGPNVNHTNKNNQNAAHIVLERKHGTRHKLDVLKLLETKGFYKFNEKDSNGCTPLDLAQSCRVDEDYDHLISFLQSKESV